MVISKWMKILKTLEHFNQVHAWFFKIDTMQIVSMRICVCVSVPEAINN